MPFPNYQNVSIMVHHRVMGTDPHVHMACGYHLTPWGTCHAMCHWPGEDPHWKKMVQVGCILHWNPCKVDKSKDTLSALLRTWGTEGSHQHMAPCGLHHTGGGCYVIQAWEDPRVQMSKAFSRLSYWALWGDRINSLCTSKWVQFSIPFSVHCPS